LAQVIPFCRGLANQLGCDVRRITPGQVQQALTGRSGMICQ
jgi:hypothetical protein